MKKSLFLLLLSYLTYSIADYDHFSFDNGIIVQQTTPECEMDSIEIDEIDDLFALIDNNVVSDSFDDQHTRSMQLPRWKIWGQTILITTLIKYAQCKDWITGKYTQLNSALLKAKKYIITKYKELV